MRAEPHPSDERDLLRAWREGEASAGHRLVERHFAMIERFFFNKASDHVVDLVQQTFLRFLEARERLRPDADVRAFLLGIARNVLYEHFRRVRRELDRFDALTHSVIDLGPSPSTRLADDGRERRLLHALRRIPIEHQLVLELYYWEGMRSREVAAVLEVPQSTARSRIQRAKQLLAAQLSAADVGYSPAASPHSASRSSAAGRTKPRRRK